MAKMNSSPNLGHQRTMPPLLSSLLMWPNLLLGHVQDGLEGHRVHGVPARTKATNPTAQNVGMSLVVITTKVTPFIAHQALQYWNPKNVTCHLKNSVCKREKWHAQKQQLRAHAQLPFSVFNRRELVLVCPGFPQDQ